MSKKNRSFRQETALERLKIREGRTAEQQLVVLDKRFGEGKGAVKERTRLQALIDNPPKPHKKRKNKKR